MPLIGNHSRLIKAYAIAHACGGILKLHRRNLQLDWDGSISTATDVVAIVAILVTGFLAWKEYQKEGR